MSGNSRDSRGQSLVELAFLMPFLRWITTGIVDFGRVYHYETVVISAARSGARVAADIQKTDSNVRTAVEPDAAPVAIADSDISITPSGTRTSGTTVTVTVTYPFAPITPLVSAIFPGER